MTSLPIGDSVLIIEPGRTEKNYWADLWRYRELFITLAATVVTAFVDFLISFFFFISAEWRTT